MGAGSKLMQDAGLKKVWSTVYNENPLPKMLEGKVDSCCLRSCLLTDTTLHFTLLSGNNENEENQIFEPMQTFDNNKDVVDFVEVGNILTIWIMMNISLRLLTLKSIAIYPVFS